MKDVCFFVFLFSHLSCGHIWRIATENRVIRAFFTYCTNGTDQIDRILHADYTAIRRGVVVES